MSANLPPRAVARNAPANPLVLVTSGLFVGCFRGVLQLAAGSAGQLAFRRARSPQELADVVERVTEHVVNDKDHPVRRSKRDVLSATQRANSVRVP